MIINRVQNWRLIIIIVAVGLIAIMAIGCKSKEIAGQWASTPMTIDGRVDDWDGISATFFEDQNATLGMANDSTYLFIYLRFRDPMWARSIKMSGLTVWLDTKGKKSKDLSIHYVGGVTPDEMKSMMGPNAGDMMQRMGTEQRERIDEKISQMDAFTLVDETRWYLPKDLDPAGSNGPAVAYATVQDFFNYEFRIPLAECSENFYGLGVQPGHVLGIGAEWGDSGMGQRPSGMRGGGMSGGGMPGGGMPPGGGMGGGRGGPPGGQRPEMPKKQEVWLKTTLKDNVQE